MAHHVDNMEILVLMEEEQFIFSGFLTQETQPAKTPTVTEQKVLRHIQLQYMEVF